jgi:hypothetical protein
MGFIDSSVHRGCRKATARTVVRVIHRIHRVHGLHREDPYRLTPKKEARRARWTTGRHKKRRAARAFSQRELRAEKRYISVHFLYFSVPPIRVVPVMSAEYPGLVLVARTGVPWRWVGHDLVTTRRGESVRVESYTGPCRTCGEDFAVQAKLPAELAARYLALSRAHAREAGQVPEVRIVVPGSLRIRAFELRNCPGHRHLGNLV